MLQVFRAPFLEAKELFTRDVSNVNSLFLFMFVDSDKHVKEVLHSSSVVYVILPTFLSQRHEIFIPGVP